MKHVSILIPAGDIVVVSIEEPHKVLRQVYDLLVSLSKHDPRIKFSSIT